MVLGSRRLVGAAEGVAAARHRSAAAERGRRGRRRWARYLGRAHASYRCAEPFGLGASPAAATGGTGAPMSGGAPGVAGEGGKGVRGGVFTAAEARVKAYRARGTFPHLACRHRSRGFHTQAYSELGVTAGGLNPPSQPPCPDNLPRKRTGRVSQFPPVSTCKCRLPVV